MEAYISPDMIRIYLSISIRYFIFAGIPFLIFYLLFAKQFNRMKIQNVKARASDFLREISHSLMTAGVFAVSGYLILFTSFRESTLIYMDINAYPAMWIPISLFLSLVIHDTYFYWMHRLIHRKKLYRLIHLEHHKSTNPSPWTSYSFGVLEAVLENAVIFLLVFILPLHPLSIFLFTVLGFIINVYGHLGYEIAPRWFRKSFLFQILATSVYHNMHHSKVKGNYGLYSRIWDRLMKTENPDYVKVYDSIEERRFIRKEMIEV